MEASKDAYVTLRLTEAEARAVVKARPHYISDAELIQAGLLGEVFERLAKAAGPDPTDRFMNANVLWEKAL